MNYYYSYRVLSVLSARRRMFTLLLLVCLGGGTSFAQSPTFTYQGRLTDGGPAANGGYDFQFRLFDAVTGGTQLGPMNVSGNVAVTNGVFTVQLNFGNPLSFPDNFSGADRYLEIAVRQATQDITVPFTTLSPRQQITSSPYAIRSASAASADTAANATALGGVAANQFVTTGDPRLSDARPPTPGNSNYVQNTTVAQTSSNFNISGNGTAGGALSGNVVNSATEYDIGGSRVLSAGGASNTSLGLRTAPANTGFANSFFGDSAGAANTNGSNNSFFGNNSGTANTGDPNSQFLGSGNAFFGSNAGLHNTQGFLNSFFGSSAGNHNTTGNGNTFIGDGAGFNNVDGTNNTYVGDNTGGTPSLLNATAIGAGASVTTSNTMVLGTGNVTVQVPGNLLVTGTLTGSGLNLTNLNAGNIASGVVAIANGGTGSATKNFVDLTTNQTIAGNKTFSSAVDTSAQYNIGGQRVLSVAGDNVFTGLHAGQSNSGSANSFFGFNAGLAISTGQANSFLGQSAGAGTTTGSFNTYIGQGSGFNNVTGSANIAVGFEAGGSSSAGNNNDIYIGNSGQDESMTIRIGETQTQTFIAGINGSMVFGVPVLVSSSGQLGTTLSSRRFKENIRNMGDRSSDLLRLRPVTFQYKPEYSPEPQTLQYGLIAEEVAMVYPNLVAYGKDGKPYTVLYHLLTPMLLNEVQKQANSIKSQQAQIQEQQKRLAEQRALVISQQEEIKQQQKMVNDLRKLVCLSHPHARACR